MAIKWHVEREPLSEEYLELPNGRMVPIWKKIHLSFRFFDEFYVHSRYTVIDDVDLNSYDFNGAFGSRSVLHTFSSTPFVVYTGFGVIGKDSLDRASYYVDSELEEWGYKSEAERNNRMRELIE